MPIKDVQHVNRQHAVPQNIMDVEFKIIGELTLRQFSYLCVFGGSAYLAAIYMDGIFKWPFVAFSTLLGLGLAFVPIQERGLDQWVLSFIKSMYSPTQKVWRKSPVVPSAFSYQNIAVVKQELITLAPTSSRRKLEEYLESEENKVRYDALDIDESNYVKLVRSAFSRDSSVPKPPVQPMPVAPQPSVQQPVPVQPPEPVQQAPIAPPPSPAWEEKKAGPEERIIETSRVEDSPIHGEAIIKPATVIQPEPPSQVPETGTLSIKHSKFKLSGPLPDDRYDENEVRLSPLTPDRHAGRRFSHLLPKQGQITLPIRGGKVLQTSEEMSIEDDINEKTEQLNRLIAQIKRDKDLQTTLTGKLKAVKQPTQEKGKPSPADDIVPKFPTKDEKSSSKITINAAEPDSEPQEEVLNLVDSFKLEFDRLTKKIIRLRADIDSSGGMGVGSNTDKVQLLEQLEQQKVQATKDFEELQSKTRELEQKLKEQQEKTSNVQESKDVEKLAQEKIETRKAEDYANLRKMVAELQSKIKESEQRSIPEVAPTQFVKPVEAPKQTSKASYANIPVLTNKPNVISGIVRTPDGKGLEGIVLVIKNTKGETVRAVKSNSLGQFTMISSMVNGMYNIETDQFHKSGFVFDIISVEAKGEVIPPIELIGRPFS